MYPLSFRQIPFPPRLFLSCIHYMSPHHPLHPISGSGTLFRSLPQILPRHQALTGSSPELLPAPPGPHPAPLPAQPHLLLSYQSCSSPPLPLCKLTQILPMCLQYSLSLSSRRTPRWHPEGLSYPQHPTVRTLPDNPDLTGSVRPAPRSCR